MFKLRNKSIPLKAPKTLWCTKSFNFVIPRSIEAYCRSLERINQEFFSDYKTYLSASDQSQVAFSVRKSNGNLGSVWAIGHLQTVDAASIRIVGKTGIPVSEILIRFCILAVIGIIMGLNAYLYKGLDATWPYGFVFGLIGLLTMGFLLLARENLIYLLKHT